MMPPARPLALTSALTSMSWMVSALLRPRKVPPMRPPTRSLLPETVVPWPPMVMRSRLALARKEVSLRLLSR